LEVQREIAYGAALDRAKRSEVQNSQIGGTSGSREW
jgi:hypothetical protein